VPLAAACATKGVDDTRALAAAVAAVVVPGDLLLLAGDLGTGKTAFAQGFAAGLGVDEQVTSPTFTLARSYEGLLRLNHLDVYRLDHLQEAVDLGLAEILDEEAVTLIEWGDVLAPALAADFLEVRLRVGEEDDKRFVDLTAVGSRWSARCRALHLATEPWRVP
jgi:tRNA threonylcarbamoyladenosine biosynthesis protein TsaE